MSILSGIPRPIIATLGDISSAIYWGALEELCDKYADSASIVFLGHLTDAFFALPPEAIWINRDPMNDLEGTLKDVDCIVCPYLWEGGIDRRVFSEKLDVPVVTFFTVPGKNVHVVHDLPGFIETVGTILTNLLTKPGAGEPSSSRPQVISADEGSDEQRRRAHE